MKSLNLCLYRGGELVDRDQLAAVATPESTATWTGVPHVELVRNVTASLEMAGLQIVHEQFGLAHEGQRMFGLMQVIDPMKIESDYAVVIGVRNSHDRKFPVGFCMGAGAFVCDNLSFSSEVNLKMKHTQHVLRGLPSLVDRGVAALITHRNKQDLRFGSYRQLELTDHHASDLILRGLEQNIVGPLRIRTLLDEWRNPRHDEFKAGGKTGWRLFNAFTEALKGSTLAELPRRTQCLHGLLDKECGLAWLGSTRSVAWR